MCLCHQDPRSRERASNDLVPSRYALRIGDIDVVVISDGLLSMKTPHLATNADSAVRVHWLEDMFLPTDETDIEVIVDRIGYQHFLQIYGMTESQGICMTTTPDDPREVQLGCCGHPLPGFDVRLVHPETGERVEGEGEGEVWMRGRTHLRYEGLDEAVRRGFYSDDGYFQTGDVMRRREDGRYEFVTRIKDLIKVGENAAAAEIERVLKEHPAIFNLQVVPVPDARRGEVPAAFVELVPGAPELDLAELQQWAGKRMAPFKVPRRLRLMRPDEWPRTPSAKIARFLLPALLD